MYLQAGPLSRCAPRLEATAAGVLPDGATKSNALLNASSRPASQVESLANLRSCPQYTVRIFSSQNIQSEYAVRIYSSEYTTQSICTCLPSQARRSCSTGASISAGVWKSALRVGAVPVTGSVPTMHSDFRAGFFPGGPPCKVPAHAVHTHTCSITHAVSHMQYHTCSITCSINTSTVGQTYLGLETAAP
jgi:hypothetical protein